MFHPHHLRWLSTSTIIIIISVLLFVKLNTYPKTLYNWENYSLASILQYQFNDKTATLQKYLGATDGLMTDSGDTLATGLPVYLITSHFGYDLGWMRIWSASLTFLGIISFFLLIAKVFSYQISILATFFFGTSQAFLLYGRTATNVGPTLLLEMLSVYTIYHLLKDNRSLKLLITSIILILINYYFYAPIRFFTPLLLLLIGRLIWLKYSSLVTKHQLLSLTKRKSRLLTAGLLGIFGLVVAYHLKAEISNYYYARGEHLFANISYQPLNQIVDQKMILTIIENAWFYLKMLFSLDSRPVIVDFGNYYGQMINRFLVPFFIIGFTSTVIKVIKKNFKFSLLLGWFLLTGLPIIFTSNVHIGRLFLNLAPMYVMIAVGLKQTIDILNAYKNDIKLLKIFWLKSTPLILVAILSLGISLIELKNYFFIPPTTDHNIRVLEEKQIEYRNKKIYLINTEPNLLHFWEIFFYLKNSVYFTDAQTLKPVDKSRGSEQIDEGVLVRSNSAYEILTKVCQVSNSALIIIGTKNAPISPAESANCQATTIFLFQ